MIEIAEPPLLEAIAEAFPHRGPGVIYAFGDRIYNPSGQMIPPALIAHELAHCERQRVFRLDESAIGIEQWWRQYLKDPDFRYQEELYGHAAELRTLKTKDRNRNAQLVMQTTLRLLAPFYEYGKSQRHFADARKDLIALAEAA